MATSSCYNSLMGILFAFGALFAWGLGDFLIQRSARQFGKWAALFYVTAIGAIALLPFVWGDLKVVFSSPDDLFILLITSVIILFAALFDFEALRAGKLSVIEPIFAFEVPITVGLAAIILGERLMPAQYLLMVLLLIGIFLVATRHFHHYRTIHLEKGVWAAVFATIGMGVINFLFGVAAREISPLMINWFTSVFLAVATLIAIIGKSDTGQLKRDWHSSKRLITSVGIIDNLAWVFYAYATLYIPIAIATGISESYIALASGLGLMLNREKLKPHQFFGLILAVMAVITLAFITKD